MAIELRPDKFVKKSMSGSFALHFGETIRHHQTGIEIINKFPGHVGTLIITNFRVYWFSETNTRRNVSIGFQCVIAVGRRKINIDKPDETHVVCILTYDSPLHREYKLKNCFDLQDLHHIEVFMVIFRAYTSTRPYRDVVSNSGIIENRQLRILPYEQIAITVEGVARLTDNRILGTFIVTNIRSVWFAEDNEMNNVSLPHLCVEKVNTIPTERGEGVVLEVEVDNQLYGWTFQTEPAERQQILQEYLRTQLVQFNDRTLVGF